MRKQVYPVMRKGQIIYVKCGKGISTEGASYELNIFRQNRKAVKRKGKSTKPPWREQMKLIEPPLLLRIIRNFEHLSRD